MPCPCGSGKDYDACCGPFHIGESVPSTAEALMCSRYSAFVKHAISYLKETTWPANQKHFDEVGYRVRAANSIWLELKVHETEAGQESDTRGTVSFTAKSMIDGQVHEQTEKSLFKKKNGKWFYVKPVS